MLYSSNTSGKILGFLIVLTLLMPGAFLSGQTPTLDWAGMFGGLTQAEGRAIAVDLQGNVIIAGKFTGTCDFDPGPGNLSFTTAGFNDAFVAKLDPLGNLVWAIQYGSSNYEEADAAAVDDAGNVYVGGAFQGTVDFDPGPGVVNLVPVGNKDAFLVKLSPTGSLIWAKQFGGFPSRTSIFDMVVDDSTQIFLTGSFSGNTDFDPGPDSLKFSSIGGDNAFVTKLDPLGDLIWARHLGVNSNNVAYGIDVDPNGNVLTTGHFTNTVDFDPDTSSFPLASAGNVDIFISKLDVSGNLVWAHRFGGFDPDYGRDIAVDALGDVYSIGYFEETVDFDPGSGTFNITANSPFRISDIYVSKLTAAGNFVFAKRMGGPGFDQGISIALDASNNIFTTGRFTNTADFDPGPGTFNLSSLGNSDIFVCKLDAQGNFRYAFGQGSGSGTGDQGLAIAERLGCAYTTGYFKNTVDFDPGPGVVTLSGGNSDQVFIQKVCLICTTTTGSTALSGCVPFASPSGNQTWTTSGIYQDTLTNFGGCDSVLTVNLTLGSPSTASLTDSSCGNYTAPSGAVFTSSGTYSDTILNAAGCDSILTINLTIGGNTFETITESVCGSYTAPSGAVFTTSGTYPDTIPNGTGCDSIITLNLTVTGNSSASISASTCGSYTAPSGAVFTASGTFLDTIQNAAGCDSILTLNLTVGANSSASITPISCGNYSAPSGTVYTASGTFLDTIQNVAGCDSIITINLTISSNSTASISASVCGSYTAPSGTVFTSSGTFLDTIPNAGGCDSIITLNLTVTVNSSASISASTCGSYTAPSGTVFTSSGTFLDTIPNAAGCDSIITINLTVSTNSSASITANTCGNYTTPSGAILTSSGTYTDTISNAAGCDSIITINLTVNTSSSASITASACGNYTAPSGAILTSSGTYPDTISNAAGCDSIITINLTVNTNSSASITASTCGNYTAPSGAILTSSGTYLDTITTAAGCDSIITINLTVNTNSSAILTESTCSDYTAPSGAVFTASGTYMDTIPNNAGCDSIMTINLTVTNINPGVTQSGNTLTAQETGAMYQWLDCGNGNAQIPGETNPSFTASASGDFAVEINKNNCVDSSSCINLMINGIEQERQANQIQIYPNPGNGYFTLKLGERHPNVQLEISNLQGKVLLGRQFRGIETAAFHLNESSGVYFARVRIGETVVRLKLVIQ